MKQLLSIMLTAFVTLNVSAQLSVNIVAEQNIIPQPEYDLLDATLGGSGPIVSYRLYAEIPDGYRIVVIYGSSIDDVDLSLLSGNTFYQNPNGAAVAFELQDPGWDPLWYYDSWLTIGTENTSQSDEYASALVLETVPFFENFELGYDVEIDLDAIAMNEAALAVVNAYDANGISTPAYNQPDENGRVLIGQLTARQFVAGCMSFSLYDIYQNTMDANILTTTCFSFSQEYLPPDFDQDGLVDVEDLMLLLEDFGCVNGCNADLTEDGMVSVNDLISFIYYFSVYNETPE